MAYKPWTSSEERRLRALVSSGQNTMSDIVYELGRSANSIHAKCFKLRLSIPKRRGLPDMPPDWNQMYLAGLNSNSMDACPYPRSDVYRHTTWMAGRHDNQMGYK